MALTGDFHRLAQLRMALRKVADGGLAKEFAFRLSNAIQRLILEGAREQHDPYGHAWAPRKRPPDWAIHAFGLMADDDHPLLDKTGRGLNSIRTKATRSGVIVTAKDYMGFHQSGTHKMVARRFVPDPALGLGPRWTEKIQRVAEGVMRDMLKGAGNG